MKKLILLAIIAMVLSNCASMPKGPCVDLTGESKETCNAMENYRTEPHNFIKIHEKILGEKKKYITLAERVKVIEEIK